MHFRIRGRVKILTKLAAKNGSCPKDQILTLKTQSLRFEFRMQFRTSVLSSTNRKVVSLAESSLVRYKH